MRSPIQLPAACPVFGRVLFVLLALTSCLCAADAPPPPSTPLQGLVKRLAEKRAMGEPSAAAPAKEELLRPEFRFQRANTWLLLPELSRELTTTQPEQAAVFELLETGVNAASELLRAEGADNDIAAAAALALTQLWSFVRQQEIPEPGPDRLHAQLVAVLAGPEVAAMSDADKQRFWEYCLGFPVFILGMQEVATELSAQEDLRTIAAGVFHELMGLHPHVLELGADGIALSPAAEAALAEMSSEAPAAAPAAPAPVAMAGAAGRDPTTTAAGVSGITYTAPAGWSREETGWATAYRATLSDVNKQGQPDPESSGAHVAAIFVLPPRPLTGDSQATFEAVWREQFGDFELGDTIVHYRARLRSGLVTHYMGRFFDRKVRSDLRPYAVLHLIDLGAGRVQPITAVVQPNDRSSDMSRWKEENAYRALAWPMEALLNSIQPVGGAAPYPAGGFFRADHLQGDWQQKESVHGGSYVNTYTGLSAGVSTHASSVQLRLGADGTYNFSLHFQTDNPMAGRTTGSDRHEGRYRLNGDVVLVEPTVQLRHPFTCCVVGIGSRQTAAGRKRMLVTVAARENGGFLAPALVPNGDGYDGIMYWYVEK